MKYYSYCLLFVLIIAIGGCNFLNYDETDNYTQSEVFSNWNRTRLFLNNIYHRIPNGFNEIGGAMRASATDDAEEANSFSNVQGFNNGRWSSIHTLDNRWSSLYSGIRAVNIFLANFDLENFKDRKYNDSYRKKILQARLFPYQARFLRALFYFRLIKRYGGVPLITKVKTPEQANVVKPSSYQEVTQFIVSECNEIRLNLTVDYSKAPYNETGRATRGAAMALKAKALLYAASPLHNPSHNRQKWIKAAKAAKAIIDAGWYQLEPNYSDAFNNVNSSGLIFGRRGGNSNYFERDNFPVGYEGANRNKYGTMPTQNLVDAYEMQKTGLPIDDPNSGYDPQHPYQGRDPRLKKTIIVNNSMWKGRKVQLWNGGLDGPPKPNASKTGYYLKKYVEEDVDLAAGETTTARHLWVIFRYGGILLDYAEAMNEAYGPYDPAGLGMTARQAVDKIREKRNMPDFPVGMSKSAFRKKLRNERRVAMAFEGERFWGYPSLEDWSFNHCYKRNENH